MIPDELKRRDSETERQYLWRIGNLKENKLIELSWQEITDLINEQFREDTPFLESVDRKRYAEGQAWWHDVFKDISVEDKYLEELRRQQDEIIKAKRQLQDQRREYNKLLITDSRGEHLYGELVHAAASLRSEKPLGFKPYSGACSPSEAVLVLCDWHFGLVTDNVFNRYDVATCKARVRKTVEKSISYLRLHRPQALHVVVLGDMAHGSIHVSCRVASEEKTVVQLMQVSEILAEVIHELSGYVPETHVHCTYGNHLRIVPDKRDSDHADNMERIIPWWLQERLKDCENIAIETDSVLNEYIVLDIRGWGVVATHGDLEKFDSFGTTTHAVFSKKHGFSVDYAIMADKHHLEGKDDRGVEAIICPALCGVDNYANDKRLFSTPSQLMLLFTEDGGAEGRYVIRLD